jgi:hypothetical protein
LVASQVSQFLRLKPYEIAFFNGSCSTTEVIEQLYLRMHNIDAPKIHDLVKLGKMCEEIDAEFSILLPKTSLLTEYGVLPRYPNEL